MADDGGLFSSAGFHVPELAAGLSGGIVKALFSRGRQLAELIPAALGGALTANFLAAPFGHFVGKMLGMDPVGTGVAGFVVGLTAMSICQQLISGVGSLTQRLRNGGPNV